MRSLTLGAALLLASAGAASACVQGDRDCADAMSLGRQPHHHLMLPDAPDEQQQKYDSARQDFGRAHATGEAAAEQEAWEKKRHPDRPPPGAVKGQEPAKAVADRADPDETPAAKTAKSLFAADRKPGQPVYLFGRHNPPASGQGAPAEEGRGRHRPSPAAAGVGGRSGADAGHGPLVVGALGRGAGRASRRGPSGRTG